MVIYNREKEELIIPTGLGNLDNEIPFNEGYQSGYTEGNAVGRREGYDNGYENGHNDGYNQGYEEGEDNGYANGHQDGVESGYTQGFGEGQQVGFENGEANQKSKMAILTAIENGHYEREDGYSEVNVNVQPNLYVGEATNHWSTVPDGGVAAYLPSSGYDGFSQFLVDFKNVHNDGLKDGFASGYTSGYTDGQLVKNLRIDGNVNTENGLQSVWYTQAYAFNGIRREPFLIIGEEDVNHDGRSYKYHIGNVYYFGVSGIQQSLETITTLDLELAFTRKEDVMSTPSAEQLNITVNDIPIVINSSTKELIWSAETEQQIPQVIYGYHLRINPLTPTEYGIGFSDGYTSGYTDGAASVSGGCRLDTNYEIFLTGNEPMDTSNTIHFGPNTEWFDGISSGAVYYQNAYQVKYNQGYQSGYTAGRSDFEVHLQDKEVKANIWSPSWTGEITITPDEGYDGMGKVRVSAATSAEINQYMQNNDYAMLESIEDFISDSAETITITSNGTYTASGSAEFNWYSPGVVRKVLPTNFKSVTVNVPSNLVVDGTIEMTRDYTFSQSEMHDAFIYGIPADSALEDITIDGRPVIGYPQNGLTILAGTHTFHANYGNLVIKVQGTLAQVGIPNGIVTYGRITRQ